MRGWASTQRNGGSPASAIGISSTRRLLHHMRQTIRLLPTRKSVNASDRDKMPRHTADSRQRGRHPRELSRTEPYSLPHIHTQPTLGRRIKTARHHNRHLSKRPPAHRILPANETDKHTTPLSSSSTSKHGKHPQRLQPTPARRQTPGRSAALAPFPFQRRAAAALYHSQNPRNGTLTARLPSNGKRGKRAAYPRVASARR
jgi:hypothetical protein